MKDQVVPNCLTRRYPSYFSGFEETKHHFTTKAEFLKIEWLVSATSGWGCYGLYKMRVGERHALVVARMGVKVPRYHVIGWFTFPPDFLNEWVPGQQQAPAGLSPSLARCLWVRLKWKAQDLKTKLFGRDKSCGLTRRQWSQDEVSLRLARLSALRGLGNSLSGAAKGKSNAGGEKVHE